MIVVTFFLKMEDQQSGAEESADLQKQYEGLPDSEDFLHRQDSASI